MKQAQWQSHVNAFNKSGLSKREYADNNQLTYHQFVYWSQKINKAQLKPSRDDFIPVTVTPASSAARIKPKPMPAPKPQATTQLGVLEFPNGIRLVIHSAEILAQLPRLLSTPLDQELGDAITL